VVAVSFLIFADDFAISVLVVICQVKLARARGSQGAPTLAVIKRPGALLASSESHAKHLGWL
jgi:hypothetical protein